MTRVRVANVNFLAGLPYREIASLDFVDYEENTSSENARRLAEREVDVALVPVDSFAEYGGFVGLDFGIAAAKTVRSVLLVAEQEIRTLRTVYVDEAAHSSISLLRILFAELWNISPKIVRAERHSLKKLVRESEGALLVSDQLVFDRPTYPYTYDIVAEWCKLTGKPFVFSIWATRPEALSAERALALNDVFHRGVKARAHVARAVGDEVGITGDLLAQYISELKLYSLDDGVLTGLREFFQRSAALGNLPRASYRSATRGLFATESVVPIKQRSVSEVLNEVLRRQRLGIAEALRLVDQAKLSELGLAVDLLRSRVCKSRFASFIFRLDDAERLDADQLEHKIAGLVSGGVSRVMFVPNQLSPGCLPRYEELLRRISDNFPVTIEGFDICSLLELADLHSLEVQEVISRLITAGLDLVPGFGCGMLIDRVLEQEQSPWLSDQILRTMQWVHRLGGKSSCCLTLSSGQTWEERLVHLQKIRKVQDESPGFRYFFLDEDPRAQNELSFDDRLRAVLISRIFLDNVPSVQKLDLHKDSKLGVMCLSFGANEASFQFSDETTDQEMQQMLDTMRSLGGLGPGFDISSPSVRISSEVH